MASPLAFRITMQVEDSGLTKATQNLRGFKNEAASANVQLKGTAQQVKEAITYFKKFGEEGHKEGKKVSSSFEQTTKEIHALSSQFRLFRRLIHVGALIGTPFILAAKQVSELQTAMQNVTGSLSQLGSAGIEQSQHYLDFIKNFTFGTTFTAVEGAQALGIIIDKLRGTADAENILGAARNLALGRGIKLTDATNALTEALNGNGESLSKLSLKSRNQINDLVRSGQLVKTIQQDFSEAAAVGSGTLSAFFKTQYNQTLGSITSFISSITGFTAKNEQENLARILDSASTVKKTLLDLGNAPIAFKSLDDMRIRFGKVTESIKEITSALDGTSLNKNERKTFTARKEILEEEYSVLQKQILSEQELGSLQREKFTAEANILRLQALQILSENNNTSVIQDGNIQLKQRLDISEKIASAQVANAHAEANAERAKLDETGGRTPEQETQIAFKEALAIAKIRDGQIKSDKQLRIQTLKDEQDLQKSKLDLNEFYLKNRLRQNEGISENEFERRENVITEKRVNEVIASAKREAEELNSQHKLSAQEEVRIENTKQLEIDKIRLEAESNRAKETKDRLKNLTEDETERVKSLVASIQESQKRGISPQSTLAFKEIQDFKKLISEREKQNKETEDLTTSLFTEQETLRKPGRTNQDLRNVIGEVATTPRAELQDVRDSINKANTELASGQIDAFYKGIKNKFEGTPVPINFKFNANEKDIDAFTEALANGISDKLKNKVPQKASAVIIQGPEQGGSSS